MYFHSYYSLYIKKFTLTAYSKYCHTLNLESPMRQFISDMNCHFLKNGLLHQINEYDTTYSHKLYKFCVEHNSICLTLKILLKNDAGHHIKKKLNSVDCSPQANYTDRAAAAC
jgi:hypothetical protein